MSHQKIAIFTPHAGLIRKATALSQRLALPLIQTIDDSLQFTLLLDYNGLSLVQTAKQSPGPIRVDFTTGKAAHRRLTQQKELLVKAAGITSTNKPTIIDATAGFGSDAFVFASKGCNITMLEQLPIVAALLRDGLDRALENPETAEIVSRMKLIQTESAEYLKKLNERADIIYLDPMFPMRKKSARVKKEMSALQKLLPPQENIEELFESALKQAKKRVIVKRPKLAPTITVKKPDFQLKGKSCRFDCYLT